MQPIILRSQHADPRVMLWGQLCGVCPLVSYPDTIVTGRQGGLHKAVLKFESAASHNSYRLADPTDSMQCVVIL